MKKHDHNKQGGINLSPEELQIIQGMVLLSSGIKAKAKKSKLFGLFKKESKSVSTKEMLDRIQDAQVRAKANELVNAMKAAEWGVKIHGQLSKSIAKMGAFAKAVATGKPPKQVAEYYEKLQALAQELNQQEALGNEQHPHIDQ